ncbi:preprotein translocase subunit YajC [Spirilliplanes yamanashiensis]|uniref:Preprotein translocase subunit YajC n=1 Tax=Spirilliplanes yamanashiensis TaxID=42233 RepID=A0A8J4DKC0_9ACTN|nr:preprotein translocase subunit YajC [Spirilliplanes yamanashiensis]MDP9818670.1 preprotein translocase subunit YajC [Spirilliplanes yamanashiensis]GIJ05127.1 hypothetical protein Sya03_44790 [Spirilliplanes yamanashiensis]
MLHAAASSGSGGGSFLPLLMIILLFGVMYFMMIRPQQKRRREAEQMQRNLTVGDDIVTIGGLHATVVSVDDDVVTVELSPGVTARYSRPAIARVLSAHATSEPVEPSTDTVGGSVVEREKKD